MAASAAVNAAVPAVAERLRGEQPSRVKALMTATAVGVAAAVAVYRLLRSASVDGSE